MTTQPATTITVAAVQMAPVYRDPGGNLESVLAHIHAEADAGTNLVVFPECTATGYMFGSLDAAVSAALPADSHFCRAIADACRSRSLCAVVGYLELADGLVHNSALIAAADGTVFTYRKVHLPMLGVDNFVTPGNNLPVFDIGPARIGVLICYDLRFPEAARTLALAGAEIICVPTNWPAGAQSSPEILLPARALENRVTIVAANRVGSECGATFIGMSRIVDPFARVVASLDSADPGSVRAMVDPAASRSKRIVVVPGVFEMDTVADRRPEAYRL